MRCVRAFCRAVSPALAQIPQIAHLLAFLVMRGVFESFEIPKKREEKQTLPFLWA